MKSPILKKFDRISEYQHLGFFPKILYVGKQRILAEHLPIDYQITDPKTGQIFKCQLHDVHHFTDFVPTILCYWAEKTGSIEVFKKLKEKNPEATPEDFACFVFKIL